MAVQAFFGVAAVWGAITVAARFAVRFLKDHAFTLGLSVGMGAILYSAFDLAVEALLSEIMDSSSEIPQRALQMMGLLGVDEVIRIVFSSATAAWLFVVSNGVSQFIKQKRWERYKLQRDREMIEGTADIIPEDAGSVSYNKSSRSYTEYLESFF